MKSVYLSFVLLITIADCSDQRTTRLELQHVQYEMDSIDNLSFGEAHMSKQRIDSLGIRYQYLWDRRDSLLNELDSNISTKRRD